MSFSRLVSERLQTTSCDCGCQPDKHAIKYEAAARSLHWPLQNVWLGVSVENQKYADERIPLLAATPAAVRFISYEPALGPVNLEAINGQSLGWGSFIHWVIVGGETGPRARPFVLGWGKDVIHQCQAAGVAVFMKQVGAKPLNREGQRCTHIRDRKGKNPAEWPEVLRVREWPARAVPGPIFF